MVQEELLWFLTGFLQTGDQHADGDPESGGALRRAFGPHHRLQHLPPS